MSAAVDLLVVGAGPAGSALAAAAAADGMRVMLVEAARHPRPKACAEYASPRIVEELRHIGLTPAAWSRAAVPLDGMRLCLDGANADLRYADANGPRTAWGLDRRTFDALLANRAADAGAELVQETSLDRLERRGPRVTGARLRRANGPFDVRASWVVGADGARSGVARQLGVEGRVRFPRRVGLVTHFSGVAGLRASGEMHVGRGLYIGLAPTPGGELNVGMALPMAPVGPAAARFEAAVASLPAVARRLRGSRRVAPIRGAAPIGHRVTRSSGPGWMLVGDAAGFVDPFTGEGIFRALRSARAAAAALRSPDPAAAYRDARRRAFASKDALTWVVQAMLAAPPVLRYGVRRLASRQEARLRFASALGDCRPALDALSPLAVFEVLRP